GRCHDDSHPSRQALCGGIALFLFTTGYLLSHGGTSRINCGHVRPSLWPSTSAVSAQASSITRIRGTVQLRRVSTAARDVGADGEYEAERELFRQRVAKSFF